MNQMQPNPSLVPQDPLAAKPNALPLVDESIESVGGSTINYLRRHIANVVGIIAVTIAFEVLIFFVETQNPYLRDPRLYFAPLLLPILWYNQVHRRIQHEFMQQFAATNNYTYAPKGTQNGLDGTLFQIGHSKSVADVVSGQYGGRPISLLTYTYITGYGKSAQTHKNTVFELQFDIVMPDILLENNSHGFGSSLFSGLAGKNFVKLEGDFNTYFSLSVPRGYEIEALEIFTPDVMEKLIEKAKLLSLEIVNGHCFVYANGVVSTKQDLYALYELAQYFDQKLGPLLGQMKGSVEAMEQEQSKNKTVAGA
jgi:hypothetical protein